MCLINIENFDSRPRYNLELLVSERPRHAIPVWQSLEKFSQIFMYSLSHTDKKKVTSGGSLPTIFSRSTNRTRGLHSQISMNDIYRIHIRFV